MFRVQEPSKINKTLTKIKKKRHTTIPGREYEEEYVSSYRMALRKQEYIANRNWKKKQYIAHSGESALEEAMDMWQGRPGDDNDDQLHFGLTWILRFDFE